MQQTLFDLENESEFERYDAENPQVYRMFKRLTLEVIRAGHKHFSAEAIINQIRWETAVRGTGEFKINNNHKPFYARKFMREFPQHAGFFATRSSKADVQ